jgi:hypothetical protein
LANLSANKKIDSGDPMGQNPGTVEKKDIVLAIFGAAVGLAGILLVFVGFVYSHAETQPLADDRKKFRVVAKVGLLPFLVSLTCAALCLGWMFSPTDTTLCWIRGTCYGGMGLTALYGIIAFLFYL